MAGFAKYGVYITGAGFAKYGVYITGAGFADHGIYITEAGFANHGVYITEAGFAKYGVYVTGCFPKTELVHTDFDTYALIGSLKVGDKIASFDAGLKKLQYTAVTEIHRYTVMEIICFNNAMNVSSTHPLMVVESVGNGLFVPKWKAAYDINVGDCLVGADGKHLTIRSKSNHWHDAGVEVLNFSTDSGVPFLVRNCVVRAENAKDNIDWSEASVTQKLLAETVA
ncbi:MAG: hypothetical protein FWD39_02705 [Clostridiales bacterium]|nr:hypothetical protein [Clostridiales bacterium]